MANGELNTSLKEVNDMINKIDQNVAKLSNNWQEFLSKKPNVAALQAMVDQYKQLGDLQIELSKHSGSGSGVQRGNMERMGENMVGNTEKIRAQLQKLGVDASTVGGTVGVSFTTMASDITRAMQAIGKSVDLTQTSNDKLNTAAQKLAEEFRKAAEKAMSEKAVDASKIIKTGIGQTSVTSALGVHRSQLIADAARLGLQPNEMDSMGIVDSYKKAYNDLIATQQQAIDKQKEFDAEFSKGKQQTSAIAGVVENYDKWEQKLAQLEKEQMELNVKQEAGVISAREAANEQSRIIREQREAKENLARINKTTEQAEREMTQKQNADIRRLNDLWNENRNIKSRINAINSKPAEERTQSEVLLAGELSKKLQQQEVELATLKSQYIGVAEAQHTFSEQAIKDLENQIKVERDLAKQNAPKVSLGSTTGDVTTVSGAYRTQIKLYEEENRLLREQQTLRKELTTRTSTSADDKHLESISNRLKQIKKDRDAIANTPLFKSASNRAEIDYAAKQTAEIRNRTNEATMATAAWARTNAQVAQTYQQLVTASNNIKNVLQNTELTTAQTRQLTSELNRVERKIKACEKNMGEFKESSFSLRDVVSQLAQGFGIMFSLQQVSLFARKLVEIRGEFELQEVALKAIVQDSLKGQEIWNQTVQNALKSPFSVKQLVTYTKQLAAYRIETDKLVDTTKRLADISAGLGVDMQRLILAYGQVKAAAYLRASEVRQFTEAGINMYGELSKYFTEIEGRAVSTADVVERVTKRMVSFDDVAEVFKRLTDEGGTFYNMQEIQSETVRGQVMKLRDAYDIMLNSIGERSQGIIKGIVSSLLYITKHWETIINIVRPLIDYFLMFKVIIPLFGKMTTNLNTLTASLVRTKVSTKALNEILHLQGYELKYLSVNWKKLSVTMKLYNSTGDMCMKRMNVLSFTIKALKLSVGSLGMAFKGLGRILSTAFKSNPLGFILVGALELYSVINKITSSASRLDKLISKASNELIEQQTESIANFKRLAETAISGDVDEQTEALQKLKNTYGDMIPAYMLELDYLANLRGNYDALTESIRSYISEKKLQEALEENKESYQDDINTESSNLVRALTGLNFQKSSDEYGKVTKGMASYMQRELESWMNEEMEGRVITDNQVYDKMASIFKQATGDIREISEIVDDMDNSWFAGIFSGQTGKNLREIIEIHNLLIEDAENIRSGLQSEAGWLEVDWAVNLEDSLKEINRQSTTYLAKQKQLIALYAQKERYESLTEKGSDRTEAEDVEYSQLEQSLKNLQIYEKELSEAREEFTSLQAEDVSNFLEVTNATTQAKLDAYDKSLQTLAEETTRITNQILNLSGGNASETLKQMQVMYQKKYEEISSQSLLLMNDWTTRWNKILADGLDNLNINESNQVIQNYIKDVTAMYGKTPQEIGKATRAAEEAIKKQIEDYTRIAAASGDLMARAITGITSNMIGDLTALQKYLKDKADELLGEETHHTSTRTNDPFQSRLSVIKEMYEQAKKLNKVLHSSDKSAKSVVSEYKQAFDTAFRGNKNAGKIWNVIQESLTGAGGWGETGGDINEEMEKGLRAFYDTVKDQKHRAELEKIFGELGVSLGEEAAKQTLDAFKKGLDDMFTDVNLTQDLKNLHIPVDFYGLFDIKAKTNDDIRAELERMKAEKGYTNISMEQWDEEFRKLYNDTLNKLNESDEKNLQERLKKYMKYISEDMSEMEKLYYQEQVALREIEQTFRYSGDDAQKAAEMERAKQKAIDAVIMEYSKKRNSQAWKDFTGTEMYTSLFGDLDKVANTTLEEMRRQLESLKRSMGDLKPTELHQLEVQLKKIDDIMKKRKPFEGIVDDIILLVRGGRADAIERQAKALENLAIANEELTKAEMNRALLGNRDEYNSSEWDILTNEIEKARNKQKRYQEEVDNATESVDSFAAAQDNLSKQLSKVGDDIKSVTQSATSMYRNWMKAAGSMKDINEEVLDSINQMANNVGNAIGDIAKLVSTGGADITAWISLIASISEIISNGIDINEATINKEIENLNKKIDNISRRIELFQKQMEKAVSMDDYFRYYSDTMDTLSAKYSAFNAQYLAARKRKNVDDEELEDYVESMEQVREEMESIREQMLQDFGGIGESGYRSAAEEFVSAWMQAFQETGDGLSGLKDNFDEFVKNLFQRQATMRIANKMLEPLMDMIDSMVGDDGVVLRSELDAVREKAAQLFPELNEALKALWNELGIGTDATDTLSGLQQGIQGITEATAEVIEGYLNSMRFFMADDNMMIRQIRDAVVSGTQNATYIVLSRIDENVRRIWDRLSDLTLPSQTAHTMAVRIVS